MKLKKRTILISLFMGAMTAFCYEVGSRIGADDTGKMVSGG